MADVSRVAADNALHALRHLLQEGPPAVAAPVITLHRGAWTRGLDVVMCLLPIAFLVVTTVVPRVRLKTSLSLPLAAVMMWVIRLAYLRLDAAFTNAAVLFGMLDALTPLSIVAGAICLFETMEETQVPPLLCCAPLAPLDAAHSPCLHGTMQAWGCMKPCTSADAWHQRSRHLRARPKRQPSPCTPRALVRCSASSGSWPASESCVRATPSQRSS
jgi:hypothetical protein